MVMFIAEHHKVLAGGGEERLDSAIGLSPCLAANLLHYQVTGMMSGKGREGIFNGFVKYYSPIHTVRIVHSLIIPTYIIMSKQ